MPLQPFIKTIHFYKIAKINRTTKIKQSIDMSPP